MRHGNEDKNSKNLILINPHFLVILVRFTQPFEKKCALNWGCTKSGFYYIKKLVTQKWCTKLSECTKSECTKPGEDCMSRGMMSYFRVVPLTRPQLGGAELLGTLTNFWVRQENLQKLIGLKCIKNFSCLCNISPFPKFCQRATE